MLETLKARKEALQAQGKKGFTLMEMLIVIAIIAVLIAIAIPVFSAQLDNAKKAADEANARSIYAIAMADYMDNNKYDNTYGATGSKNTNGDYLITVGTDTQKFTFSDKGTVEVTATDGKYPTVVLTGYGDPINFGS